MKQISVEVKIRRADETDAELIAAFGAQTFRETYACNNTPEDLDAYIADSFSPAQIAAELKDSSNRFFISSIQEEIAGYAKLRERPAPSCVTAEKPIKLARIYVASDRFGCGAGKTLMRTCLDEVERGGNDALWLIVWKENHRALSFYRKWGFTEVGEHRFQIGSNAQTDWVMKKIV